MKGVGHDLFFRRLLDKTACSIDQCLKMVKYDEAGEVLIDSEVFMVAEARWYGSQFLLQASEPDLLHYRAAEDLMHAAACYAAEHSLMWELWDLAGGNGNPDAFRRLADRAVRRQMAGVIEQAREQDGRAARHIERSLERG